jgi:hypothetical protein
MGQDPDRLRRMYGPGLPGLVALTFAVTLLLGLWFHAMRQPTEGAFSSLLGVVGAALGTALGQLVAAVAVRRRLRR